MTPEEAIPAAELAEAETADRLQLARQTPTRFSCHLTCYKGRRAPRRTRTNCRQVQHLNARLAEHAAGRGARLTQVQLAAGATWRLASAEPGARDRETQLKERGAAPRCQICKDQTQAAAAAPPERDLEAEP
jgi:predicted GIY-YIG superfamily endonuclease